MSDSSLVPGMTRARLRLVLGSLMLAVLLSSMDISILATALPTIAGEFNAFESFAWVGTAYIATSAIGTPLIGKLSDIYGRRIIFQLALGLFILGSLLCGLAQSMNQLVAFRGVQGLGCGAIQVLAFAILGDIMPPRERGRYVGYFTLAVVAAALLGPVAGGFIIEHWTWPWVFYINIPLAGVAAAVSYVALDLPFHRRKVRIDYAGATLLAIIIGSLIVALELGGTDGWSEPIVFVLLVAVVVGVVTFVMLEQRVPEPMIPLHLFTNRVVLMSIFAGMSVGTIAFGAAQFLPLYFQDSLFVSPTESGLRMLPQMIGVTIGTFGIGRLILVTGRYKLFPVVGTGLAVVGLFAISNISGSTSYVSLILPMVAAGAGVGAVFTSTSIATQNAVDFQDLGVATATVMFFRILGGSLGLAAFGAILTSTVRSELPSRLDVTPDEAVDLIREPAVIAALDDSRREAVVDGLASGVGNVYLMCAGLVVIGFIAATLLPEHPLRTRAGLSDALEAEAATAAGAAG